MVSRRGQTLVKGHTLLGEGMAFDRTGTTRLSQWYGYGGTGHGKCSCGALSPELPSASARKRWHAEHKREVSA